MLNDQGEVLSYRIMILFSNGIKMRSMATNLFSIKEIKLMYVCTSKKKKKKRKRTRDNWKWSFICLKLTLFQILSFFLLPDTLNISKILLIIINFSCFFVATLIRWDISLWLNSRIILLIWYNIKVYTRLPTRMKEKRRKEKKLELMLIVSIFCECICKH